MFRTIRNLAKQRTWQFLAGIVVIFALIALARILFAGGDANTLTGAVARDVQVAAVGNLGSNAGPLRVIGSVKSRAEAELRAESSGTITRVSFSAGDRVPAGTVIAAIENSAQLAAISQARARLLSAEANLAKVESGIRAEQLAVLNSGTASAESALRAAQNTARNALLSAYANTEAAIPLGVDAFIDDAERENPLITFNTSDNQAQTAISNSRVRIQRIVEAHQNKSLDNTETSTELIARINSAEVELREIRDFLDLVIFAIDRAIPSTSTTAATISGYATTAQTARTNTVTALSTLSNARAGLESAENALEIAQQQQQEGTTGARTEDIDAARASVLEAQGALAAAQANFENTQIRTPIGGVLTTFSAERGDFVSQNQALGIVANNQALEIVAFVPAQERSEIVVGNSALVNNRFDAVVTSVATGLDIDRRQIEVKIGLNDEAALDSLTHGESVSVLIDRTEGTDAALDVIALPVSAIKFSGTDAFVFVVEDGVARARSVTLGDIVGRNIVVTDGISSTTEIIIDVRGLTDGDPVSTATDVTSSTAPEEAVEVTEE